MPGLVGLVTRMPRERAERELVQMLEALRHDPSYVTGTWVQDALGVYVGWVLRKDSFGELPIRHARGDGGLVLAGEVVDGDVFDATGRSPVSFPAALNGRFHGLLTDRARGTALLFNDRYGMQRTYYHDASDAFYFAAEAKAILAVRPELRRVDPRGLGELVACGCVLENRTLFTGVQTLPPAAAWIIRDGSVAHKETYFRPAEWEGQDPLGRDAYCRALRDVFAQALPRYFQGPHRIGMSLTGGLDSRLIMAWRKPAAGSLPCYTFTGMLRDCRDVRLARRVARVCEQSHESVALDADFLARFPDYAARAVYLTDAAVDVSRAADLYLNERAREIAPVRMTGNYGGEILRGVRAFKPVDPAPGVFGADLLPHLRRARDTYDSVAAGHPVSFAAFRQAPWHHHGLLALEESQLSVRSPYLDNDFVRTVFRAPTAPDGSDPVSLRLIAEGNPALGRIPTDRGPAGRGLTAMVARAVLDVRRKAEYAYDYAMPQWLARLDRVLAPCHLERLFLGEQRFAHFRTWYRDSLSGYVREVLLDPRTLARPFFERSGVEAIVQEHLAGRRNYTSTIHKAITLELVHRLFVDG